MKTVMLIMVTILGLLVSAVYLEAGTFKKISDSTIEYYGKVAKGDADDIYRYLERNDKTTVVRLNSEGGDALEGYRLGYLFRSYNLETVVGYDAKCLSACAVAYLGGTRHILAGVLGFHVAWLPREVETNEAIKRGQFLGSVDSGYMYNMGYRNQLSVIISQITTHDTFLIIKSVDDLRMFRFTDGNFNEYKELPKKWLSDRLAGPRRLSLLIGGH